MSCNNNITFGTFGNSIIYAGVIGENEVRSVSVDCTTVLAEFETYTVTILIQLPGSSEVNPAPCTVNNGILTHTFTDTELQTAGMGIMTIMITSLDGRVKKSANATLMIGDVLTQAQEVPTEVENWIASVTSKLIPDSGVPYSELAEGVQDSLDKADTALQEADLTPYRTAADQDALDQEYRESIAPSLAKADTALQASALTPYRTAENQDALDTAYRESIAPSLSKADTALQAAALEPYRTAAAQDAIDEAAFAAIEPKLIPDSGVAKNQLATGVQASLDKADTALQSSALTPYRTAADQDAIDSAFFSTTDTTLTEAGQPADAKAVGDRIDSLVSTPYYGAYPNANAEGVTAVVNDGAEGVPVKSITVNIDPDQSGTGDPSPDNIRPFSGYTQAKIEVSGHNIASVTATSTSTGDHTPVPVVMKAGISYRVRCKMQGTGTYSTIYFYNGSKLVDESATSTSLYRTIVPSGSVDRVIFNSGQSSRRYYDIYISQGPNSGFLEYDGDIYTIAFPDDAGVVYAGSLTINTDGTATLSALPFYESYNGETLEGRWLSDRDVYAEGTTPTTGAQVVDLDGAGTVYTFTAEEIKTVLGYNYFAADTGNVSVNYRADTTLYIASINAPSDADMIADSNIPANQYFIVGNTLYISTTAISQGETIAPGTNCTLTNIVEALNALNAANA